MLHALGYEIDGRPVYAALPDQIRTGKPLDLPPAMSEVEVRMP